MSLEVLKFMIDAACENGELTQQEMKTLREKASELDIVDRDLEFLISTSMRKAGFPTPDFEQFAAEIVPPPPPQPTLFDIPPELQSPPPPEAKTEPIAPKKGIKPNRGKKKKKQSQAKTPKETVVKGAAKSPKKSVAKKKTVPKIEPEVQPEPPIVQEPTPVPEPEPVPLSPLEEPATEFILPEPPEKAPEPLAIEKIEPDPETPPPTPLKESDILTLIMPEAEPEVSESPFDRPKKRPRPQPKEINRVTGKTVSHAAPASVPVPPVVPADPEASGFISTQTPPTEINTEESGFVSAPPPERDVEASGFISSPLPSVPAQSPAPQSETQGPEFTHLIDLKGQGGMSLVQKGQLFGKWVVIKRLKPELNQDPKYRSLFNQEFENVFHLEHDHIIRTLGRGEDESGPFYYMEFVDGRPLSEVLLAGPMHPRQARRYFSQILEGLDYVHKKQIIHRDLKPDNIIITYKGDSVKILDFGLAAADAFEDDLFKVGTPKYAAPEQADRGTSVNQTADLYSAGLLYYEMLTGQLVDIDPALIRNDTDAQIIATCLSEDPNDRYSGAWEILDLLKKETSGFSTRPESKPEPEDYPEVRKTVTETILEPIKARLPLWIGIASGAVALILALFIIIPKLGPAENLYVIASQLYARSEPKMDQTTEVKLPYGHEVKIGDIKDEWVEFDYKGATYYLPSKYLGTEREYQEIDAIYGNEEARELVKESYLKRALRDYFISHDLVGDLSKEEQQSLYGEEKELEQIWQIYGLSPEKNDYNVVAKGAFSENSAREFSVIISQKYNRRVKRKLLIFSFDEADSGHLLASLDLSNFPGYYVKEVKRGDMRRFSKQVRNKLGSQRSGIYLGKNAGKHTPYVYIYENGDFQIHSGSEISK